MKPEWIAFGAALIALISLVIQQWWLINSARAREKRTANKLTILHLCKDKGYSQAEIVAAYKGMIGRIDESEIRKTIYEMLCDDTLIFVADEDKYEVRSHMARTAIRLMKEFKMRILSLLQAKDLTEDQLLVAYNKSYDPGEDGVRRFREAIYEMIAEETIRFQKDSGTYRARWRHTKKDRTKKDQ